MEMMADGVHPTIISYTCHFIALVREIQICNIAYEAQFIIKFIQCEILLQ